VDNVSFLLDLKIILKTLKKLLIIDGISAQRYATVEAFNGEN
jgi:lipopolysaccharide/colanic/teichoic acid biosynthesis glycosyltransferase